MNRALRDQHGRVARCALGRGARSGAGLIVGLVSLGLACKQETHRAALSDGQPVTRSATSELVELKATVTPAELPFDRRAILVIEATAAPSATVELRGYDDLLREAEKQFEIRAIRRERGEAIPQPGGKLGWRHAYDLEFFVPGDYELPGASLTYFLTTDPGDEPTSQGAGSAEVQSLSTEPIPVKATQTAVAAISPEDLQSIRVLPPVELPDPWAYGWLAGAAILAGLIAAVWIIRRRRAPTTLPIVNIAAHEWAREQLAVLAREDLIARRRIQDFYYRISGIVRGYIERRFGLHALEMTTEEFLTAAARDPRFGQEARVELNRFLTACDLVKYARFEPEAGHPESLMGIVGDFVERTRERDTESAAASQERAA
jgi:hypothetical protein